MSAQYDPKKTFAYVKEVQALPPPTTIENAIRDDNNYTFTQPFFYSSHQLGHGSPAELHHAAAATRSFYTGPTALTPPPTKTLPSLQDFEESSVLRKNFERDFPRPLRRVQSSVGVAKKMVVAGGVKDELRCDRITALAMGAFLEGLGCPVHDCVTPNDFAVRLAEALRLQYNLDAELSTAKLTGHVKHLSNRSETLQRLEQKNASGADAALHLQQRAESQWPKEAVQLIEELRRTVRGQAFDIEQLRDRLDGRIKPIDLKRSQRCVGALRESLKDMAKEVGFIRDDIKDAFVQFTREYEELPSVKEFRDRQPKLRVFDRSGEDPALMSQSVAAPPPAAAAPSTGALLRLCVRAQHAAAQYAGDVCNVDMHSDTTSVADFAPAIVKTLNGAGGLTVDDYNAMTSHDGSEKALVGKALRGAAWALQMLKELSRAREDLTMTAKQLEKMEGKNRDLASALAALQNSTSPRDARSPPAPSSPVAGKGRAPGKPSMAAPSGTNKERTKALPPSAAPQPKSKGPVAKPGQAVAKPGKSVPPVVESMDTNVDPTSEGSTAIVNLDALDTEHHVSDDRRDATPTAMPSMSPRDLELPTTESMALRPIAQSPTAENLPTQPRDARQVARHAVFTVLQKSSMNDTTPITEQSTVADLLVWLERGGNGGESAGRLDDDFAFSPEALHVVHHQTYDREGTSTPRPSGAVQRHSDPPGGKQQPPPPPGVSVSHRGAPSQPQSAAAQPHTSTTATRGAAQQAEAKATTTKAPGAGKADANGHADTAPAHVPAAKGTTKTATPKASDRLDAATPAAGRRPSSDGGASAAPGAPTTSKAQDGTAPKGKSGLSSAAPTDPGSATAVPPAAPIPEVKVPSSRKSMAAALRGSVNRAQGPSSTAAGQRSQSPLTASPIPPDVDARATSPTSPPEDGMGPDAVVLPAIAATPSISPAQVLKFKFTAASPKPAATSQRTVAHASDADRLERMRRALEGGLQLHRFKTAHQLLFDEGLDVPTPEPTEEERSLHRIGQPLPSASGA